MPMRIELQRPPWVDVFSIGALPGLLLGIHLTGLIFFLNPHLPFEPVAVLRAVGLYGTVVAAVSLLGHLPFVWARPRRARRLLPWSLTGALTLAAVLDWTHAAVYTFFMPPGMNVRLIKAAVWLSIAALIAFYTALLHTLNRRAYGVRSRIGLALLVVASIYVTFERREAFQPQPEPSPLPSSVEATQRPTLLIVGLDSATLDALLPLAEQGHLPFLARVLQEGAYGRLTSLSPYRREALWTSLATGKYPYKHGVVGQATYEAPFSRQRGRLRILPEGIGFRYWGVGREEGTAAALTPTTLRLWEILPRLGLRTGVIGWPAWSRHAEGTSTEPVFLLPERFFKLTNGAASGHPPEVVSRARLFRVRQQEIDPVLLSRFPGRASGAVREALAEDLWRESVSTVLFDQYRRLEALFVQLPGLQRVSRAYFGGYAAKQFMSDQHPDYQRAADTLSAYYSHLDAYLARLWEARRGPGILAVVSPYGVEEPRGWRYALSELAGGHPVAGYVERSPDGVIVLYGEGIEAGALLTGASLVDLVPTLVYGLGLPIARDLDGKILTTAFHEGFLARHPLTFLPSYDTLRDSVE